MLAIKFGSNLPEKLGPEGVIESGSHISYTKTLEEQTEIYLSTSPPNQSMMLVWNNLANPHLSAFSHFAWFSQTVTLNQIEKFLRHITPLNKLYCFSEKRILGLGAL